MRSQTKSTPKRSFQQLAITPISEIPTRTIEATKPFNIICQGTITAAHKNKGFYYDACTTCTRGVSKKGGTYWCYKCK
ncbi:hypothetical protein AQUCO_03700031v1 [Aquilegia coerulea]|uniref:Replication factor A C-terminal domain-containing protein n=1 Tax=Aquilegia coerulea TaxID=218851 RepID=A0A2G5CTA8_AQUCA|nr:hypothetical protein AQUCO_03700031v1 [Aquilegia coerulea]